MAGRHANSREVIDFPTANPPTSPLRIRRTIASLGKLMWRMSIAEFAENLWGMFVLSFISFIANLVYSFQFVLIRGEKSPGFK